MEGVVTIRNNFVKGREILCIRNHVVISSSSRLKKKHFLSEERETQLKRKVCISIVITCYSFFLIDTSHFNKLCYYYIKVYVEIALSVCVSLSRYQNKTATT